MTREKIAPSSPYHEIFEHGGGSIREAEPEIKAAGPSPAARTLFHLLRDELSIEGSEIGDDGRSAIPSPARGSKTIRPSLGVNLVPKEERPESKAVPKERRNVDPMCANASNPYHQCTEYCAQRTPVAKRRIAGVQKGEKRGNEKDGVMGGGRNVDPMCINASNPYHRCTEYCAQRTPEAWRPTGLEKTVPNGERYKEKVMMVERGRNVDPKCTNSSNPYHRCTEYCLQRTPEARRRHEEVQHREKIMEESGLVRLSERNVDPICVNASNPYHRCTEYCSQRTPKAKIRTPGGKSDINREGGSSEERNPVRGRNANLMCPNTSNPYHRCTKYCSQRTPEARRRAMGK